MATAESLTLDEDQQQAAARQLQFQNLRRAQERQRQQLAQKNEQRLKSKVSTAAAPVEALNAAAIRGYRRIWQISQEAVEDVALSFVDFMIISGPAAVLLFLGRWFVGNLLGGGMNITYKNFSMPLVPGYTITEGIVRTSKFLFIGLITGVIWSAIAFAGYIFINAAQTGLGAFFSSFCWLSKFFGNPCGI